MADNSTVAKAVPIVATPKTELEQILERNADKTFWEHVEVPALDIFGKPHTGVSINFKFFGPGTHYVDPETAGEIRRLLRNRQDGDLRILQPNQDKKMLEIMERNGVRR